MTKRVILLISFLMSFTALANGLEAYFKGHRLNESPMCSLLYVQESLNEETEPWIKYVHLELSCTGRNSNYIVPDLVTTKLILQIKNTLRNKRFQLENKKCGVTTGQVGEHLHIYTQCFYFIK